jgi:hypothetical protein
MTNSVERLIEGMIATIRADVLPHVSDAYARGQAIGVIDLLNGLAPRLERRQAPLRAAIARRRGVIAAVRLLLPDAPVAGPVPAQPADPQAVSATDLEAMRDALDDEISALIRHVFDAPPDDPGREAARALLRRHMHDDVSEEMKLTRKPLFAEIATGGGKPAGDAPPDRPADTAGQP